MDVVPCLLAMLGDLEKGNSKLHRNVGKNAAPDTAKWKTRVFSTTAV